MNRRALGLLTLVLLAVGCGRSSESVPRVEPFRMERDGLNLVGDLHWPAGRPRSTAVLLLHGSCRQGRGLALYPELARRIASAGFVVLNLDQRAYGASDDPATIASAADLDFVGDAQAAAATLQQRLTTHGVRRIACVGHSFGGGVAIAAGMDSPVVSTVVSISPGRRMPERFFAPEAEKGRAYVSRRKADDMQWPTALPVDITVAVLQAYCVERLRGQAVTRPLLLVEGAREPADDLAYSRALVQTLKGKVQHIVIDNANHYFGTSVVKTDTGKQWAVVDEPVTAELAAHVVAWLTAQDEAL